MHCWNPNKEIEPASLYAGEINTLQGNLNWVASREHSLSNPVWQGREEELLPLCSSQESDSANLDHVAELLVRTGTGPQEALMVLVPEAYDNHPTLQKTYPEVSRPIHILCPFCFLSSLKGRQCRLCFMITISCSILTLLLICKK